MIAGPKSVLLKTATQLNMQVTGFASQKYAFINHCTFHRKDCIILAVQKFSHFQLFCVESLRYELHLFFRSQKSEIFTQLRHAARTAGVLIAY